MSAEHSTQYVYDPLGRRLATTANGLTTRYLYDGLEVIGETDATGMVTATQLFGPSLDELLALARSGVRRYASQDGLNSVIRLTDASGTLTERTSYDVFGMPTFRNSAGTIVPTSLVGNPILFTGREYELETELYCYRARFYDPRLGRFLQRDPLGQGPDAHVYRYVGNNPVDGKGSQAGHCREVCSILYFSRMLKS